MSVRTVRNALFDAFTEAWDLNTPAITGTVPELRYQNLDEEDADPPQGFYAHIETFNIFGDQQTLGEKGCRVFQDDGVVRVRIYAPAGSGMEILDDLVEVAKDVFQGETIDGICLRRTRVNEVGAFGSHYQTNVLADFEVDERK